MSIDFGWAWCRGADRSETTPSPESQALTEEDKVFFYEGLMWLLMYVGITCVTAETIPVIVARMRLRDAVSPRPILSGEVTPEFLTKFIGYSTNVAWASDAEFFAGLKHTMKHSDMDCSKQRMQRARTTINGLLRSHAQYIAKAG